VIFSAAELVQLRDKTAEIAVSRFQAFSRYPSHFWPKIARFSANFRERTDRVRDRFFAKIAKNVKGSANRPTFWFKKWADSAENFWFSAVAQKSRSGAIFAMIFSRLREKIIKSRFLSKIAIFAIFRDFSRKIATKFRIYAKFRRFCVAKSYKNSRGARIFVKIRKNRRFFRIFVILRSKIA